MDSIVCGFYGRRGAGKTLTMTAWAWSFLHSPMCVMCKHLYRTFENREDDKRALSVGSPCPQCGMTLVNNKMLGWKCFANYNVKFGTAFFENIAEYISSFPDELTQSVLLVDETPAVASSRRSMSSLNLMFSLFVEQLRKRRVHLFYTAQNPMRIDRSIYWQTDVAFDCKASPKARSVKLEIYDNWGTYVDNGATVQNWPPERDPDRQLFLTKANRFWDFYDTEEIVMPTEYFKRQKEAAKAQGLVAEEVQLDPESPEGIAAASEMNGIFDEISSVGVDKDVLIRRFQRRKLPVGRLDKELKSRGYSIEILGRGKQKVYPPEPN